METSLEFEIDTSILDEARNSIGEMREEYAKLLLDMNSGSADTNALNESIIGWKDSMIAAKEDGLLPLMEAVQNSDQSDSEKLIQMNELSDGISTYKDEVISTTDGMISLNEAMYSGNEITIEQINAWSDFEDQLLALGLSEEDLNIKTLSLADTGQVLNDAMATGWAKTEGFAVATEDYANTLGTKLAPVYDTIIAAKHGYNQALLDGQAAYEADVMNAQAAVTENSNIGGVVNYCRRYSGHRRAAGIRASVC